MRRQTLTLNVHNTFSQAPIRFVPCEDIGTDDCSLRYYSVKTKEWRHISLLNPLDRLASIINVQGYLYAVGGLEEEWELEDVWSDSSMGYFDDDYMYDRETEHEYVGSKCKNLFSVYIPKDNVWRKLPPLPSARHSMLLVHLRGFIYAIAGLDKDDNELCHVERYSFAQKKWETLAALPKGFKCVSAVAFQDKVLVYGVSMVVPGSSGSESSRKHVILLYNASKNVWLTKLSKQVEGSAKSGSSIQSPALFVYKGQCYKILYQKYDSGKEPSVSDLYSGYGNTYIPSVNKLELHTRGNAVSLSVGEEVKQDLIPGNTIGAFRIEQKVFVNQDGFVFKTDLKIEESQTVDVNLDAWKSFRNSSHVGRFTNLTSFTFDWKKARYSY